MKWLARGIVATFLASCLIWLNIDSLIIVLFVDGPFWNGDFGVGWPLISHRYILNPFGIELLDYNQGALLVNVIVGVTIVFAGTWAVCRASIRYELRPRWSIRGILGFTVAVTVTSYLFSLEMVTFSQFHTVAVCCIQWARLILHGVIIVVIAEVSQQTPSRLTQQH